MNTTITLSDIAKEFESSAKELKTEIDRLREKIHGKLNDEFLRNGGCTVCRGRGWIVTHDTLDSLSGCYAIFGTCTNPKCSESTRKSSGLQPTWSIYDKNQGIPDPVESSNYYKVVVQPLQDKYDYLQGIIRRIDIVQRESICKRGNEIIVIKGRKVPIGTIGRIEYVNPSQYGYYLKCLTADGKEFRVSIANVDVVYNPSIHSF